jgi:hypothetical protein
MGHCPHTARKRRGALLNVLTGGRRGRRAKEVSKWGVTLVQDIGETAWVEVEAKDEHEAAEKALEMARAGETAWEGYAGAHNLDVINIERLEASDLRQGRRAKKPWEGRNWRNFGLGAVPHSFAEFKRAINEGRKEKTWYEWSGLVDGKDVRLKGYEKWLQIYVVDGVDYSPGGDLRTVRQFNEALYEPWIRRTRMDVGIGYTDLPAPKDRFLIGDTGIEAWDHLDNPKSGDDPYALELARKAVMAKDWTHPSYAREEVSRAIYAFFPGGPGALI